MQHGLLSSSSVFTFGPPNKSLAYILADEGYDVWLPNTRGNRYSHRHTTLDPSVDKAEYWDFDWHEAGKYDEPAAVDYILNATGAEKVSYVGHSQGSTIYYVFLSERPEYNSKINVGVTFAPPVFMSNATTPLFLLADYADDIEIILHLFGFYEFAPHSNITHWFGETFCAGEAEDQVVHDLCQNIGFSLFGVNLDQLNVTMMQLYLDNKPEGSSVKPLVHYTQLYQSGRFAQFDYGTLQNLIRYGQATPPDYDLGNIVTPTIMFAGDKDDLADYRDIQHLSTQIPNLIEYVLVDYDGWTHNDFEMGIDADRLVYERTKEVLNTFNF